MFSPRGEHRKRGMNSGHSPGGKRFQLSKLTPRNHDPVEPESTISSDSYSSACSCWSSTSAIGVLKISLLRTLSPEKLWKATSETHTGLPYRVLRSCR